jgi:hypothetical protein
VHATLCDYLADCAQNSIEAGATAIDIEMFEDGTMIGVSVNDNGKGMDAATLARVWDPFFSEPGKHDRRRVGLGLPWLRQAVEAAGGGLSLAARPGCGARLRFSFAARHLDTPPLGDLPVTLAGLLAQDGDFTLRFERRRGAAGYTIDSEGLRAALGNLREAGNLALTRAYLRAQEEGLSEAKDHLTAAAPPPRSGE